MKEKRVLTNRQVWCLIAVPMILLQIIIMSTLLSIYYLRPCDVFKFDSLNAFQKACPQIALPADEIMQNWGEVECSVRATNSEVSKLKNSYQNAEGGAESAQLIFKGANIELLWTGYSEIIAKEKKWTQKETYDYRSVHVWVLEKKSEFEAGKITAYRFAKDKTMYSISSSDAQIDLKAAIESIIDALLD